MNFLEQLNQQFFLRINATPDAPPWALSFSMVAADYFIYAIPLILLALWLWGDQADRSNALKAVAVAFIALGINQLLAIVLPHPRPFMMGIGHTFIAHASDSSFPSDHATVFSAIGFTLLRGRRATLGWAVLLAGSCVAWARIFLGVHFPLDMLGAALVSLLAYWTLGPAWRRFGNGLTDGCASLYRKLLAWPIARGWIRA